MDFGGFILFALLAVVLLFRSIPVITAIAERSPQRWRLLRHWGGGLLLLAIFGRYLYQVYGLDEGLFAAAARGDAAQVKALLSAGASPNAEWEDGTSALSAARRSGHKDVVTILKQAGASE